MKEPTDTFDALYRAYAPSVFRRAQRVLGSTADAHDVVNDVFLSLYENPAQYRSESSLPTFLYSMATNACLNRLKSQKNRARLLEGHEPHVVEPPLSDRLVLLRRVLARMPEPLARVAVYYYFDELTHREIATLMGCSHRHVGHLLERLSGWSKLQEIESS